MRSAERVLAWPLITRLVSGASDHGGSRPLPVMSCSRQARQHATTLTAVRHCSPSRAPADAGQVQWSARPGTLGPRNATAAPALPAWRRSAGSRTVAHSQRSRAAPAKSALPASADALTGPKAHQGFAATSRTLAGHTRAAKNTARSATYLIRRLDNLTASDVSLAIIRAACKRPSRSSSPACYLRLRVLQVDRHLRDRGSQWRGGARK